MKFKPDVGCVGRDVVLASGIKVLFGLFPDTFIPWYLVLSFNHSVL